jgi:hypothetical protein
MKTYIMYQIKCNDANIEYTYVGHTTNFRVRKSSHKANCNNENLNNYNLKIYQFIRENGGWDNWEMLPLEEYQCETTIQSRIREQYWMDIKQSKLNSSRAHNTTEEEKEQTKNYNKQYRVNNKDILKAYNKQYILDNKETIKESGKKNYIKNKEAILEKQKQRIVCECGSKIAIHSKNLHMKTIKHLELMSKLNL